MKYILIIFLFYYSQFVFDRNVYESRHSTTSVTILQAASATSLRATQTPAWMPSPAVRSMAPQASLGQEWTLSSLARPLCITPSFPLASSTTPLKPQGTLTPMVTHGASFPIRSKVLPFCLLDTGLLTTLYTHSLISEELLSDLFL